jgi:hypothetical protein
MGRESGVGLSVLALFIAMFLFFYGFIAPQLVI